MGINDSFHEGLKAFREARYDEAVRLLREAVTRNEEDHKAWNALGVTYYKMGNTKEAIACYNTALKYDPGNESYLKNRDQIVQSSHAERKSMNGIVEQAQKYQKYLIPSVIAIFVAIAAIYCVFFYLLPVLSNSSHALSPVPESIPSPEITPNVTELPETETVPDQNLSGATDIPTQNATPVPLASGSGLIVDDAMSGKYQNRLQELTFTIRVPPDGTPQFMPRINYLWSTKSYPAVSVIPMTVSSGTINPGEERQVTIAVPSGMEPKAGESFTLEIKPPSGTSTKVQKTLPAGYGGGEISAGGSTSSAASVNQSASNLALSGSMQGYYTKELEELTLSLMVPLGGTPQDLGRLKYLISVGGNTSVPIPTQNINPSSGSITPGDSQLITLKIPVQARPRAGETFTLEVKPDSGASLILEKTLPIGYSGGIIS